jgi:hypothetical protein
VGQYYDKKLYHASLGQIWEEKWQFQIKLAQPAKDEKFP